MAAASPVVIVGAGMAGLTCAWRLTERGRPCVVLEASDGVGGRVRTDRVDGFQLDRGFQILLTSYPDTARVINFAALDLCNFNAGAMVRRAGGFHEVYDPLRHPSGTFGAALTPLFSAADKLRLLELWAHVMRFSPEELLARGINRTTEAELAERGFTAKARESFLEPFFGGIFLQRPLTTSSRYCQYLFRMFATGRAAVPAKGMGAIPQQLADRLTAAGVKIRLNTRVVQRTATELVLASGERVPTPTVVIATALSAARGLIPDISDASTGEGSHACTVYFDSPKPVVRAATLVLGGDGGIDGPVNNLCELTAVAPSYAPPGRHLLSVSVVNAPDDDATLHTGIREQLTRWYGSAAQEWRHLRTDRIAEALPPAAPPDLDVPHRPVRLSDDLFVCGDHRDHPSIEGAVTSGLRAADAIVGSP